MYYDYYQNTACEYDDNLVLKGICSTNPAMSSLQEIILIYLKGLAYYLLKLKELGASNEVIKETILEAISCLIINESINNKQIQKLLVTLHQDLNQSKNLYITLCEKNKKEAKFLKHSFKPDKGFDLSNIIKKGEKYYLKRNISYTLEEKNLFDVILFLIKNLCLKIFQIRSYKKSYEKTFDTILKLLNTINFNNITTEEVKSIIEDCSRQYYKTIKELSDIEEKTYGKREYVHVSFSARNGKAILVSGIDMTQLDAVLKATKNQGIDVYTHGITMLMAHTLEKFRKYPHLAGHFGKGFDNSLFDFAAFPGAILMTRYLFQKIEYLYKGRLFTTDSFAPSGVIKIKNNDFEPLIQAALKAKGFTKKQQEIILKVGFKQKEMEKKIKEITQKMEKNEIKHLYIIGLFHHENPYKKYFNDFISLMPKDCYAFSLSHERNEENVLHIDSFYDYLFIYKIFEKFNTIKPIEQLKITIFITKCDQYTITNIINFLNMGIKSIYLCKCVPSLINPSITETLYKTFGVKEFSTPEEDLKNTLTE